MNLPSVVRSRPVLLTAGLFLLVALVCTQIPLLNYLGYEFSFLMALLASFASGLLAIRSFRSERPLADAAPEEKVRHLLRSTRQTLAALFVVLVVPVVVMTANLLFVRNCSFAEGLAFYLLLPAVSAVVGSSLGVMCAALHRLPSLKGGEREFTP